MTRCGKTSMVVVALVCAGLLSRGRVAHGDDGYKYERGGVLFYAGFNGMRDADCAAGDGKAHPMDGGGALTADGVDSIRGSALRTGDGIGYLEFSAEGNVLPDEGTMEMWVRPENWDSDDKQQHVFLEILGEGGGSIRFYKRADTVNSFWVKAPDTRDPSHYDEKYAGIVQTGYACQEKRGDWTQYFLIWKRGELIAYYRGYTRYDGVDRSQHYEVATPSPGKLTTIRIGDFGAGPGRQAATLIDEVYIYNRALTEEECVWANVNATNRAKGMDVPTNFAEPTAKVVPDPEKKTLVVEIDSCDRSGNFAGTARLEPALGTSPAPIVQTEGRFGEARIPYEDLPKGEYQVIVDVTTKDGKPIKNLTVKLVSPGPPVWLTEKVGASDTPPPPWGPVKQSEEGLEVWGRRYSLGPFGLPRAITTQGKSILAGPVELRFVSAGEPVAWQGTEGEVTKATEAQVVESGEAAASIGRMTWSVTAEFDGYLQYDFDLAPAAEATAELIELRVPLKKEYAYLYFKHQSQRGFLPKGDGAILKEGGSGRYWWIGTDDFGLCGATEHAGANLDDAKDAFSIVREPDGDITVVYRFLGKSQKLTAPWKLRWVLQATPTKPLPKDWRTWRDVSRAPDGNHRMKLAVMSVGGEKAYLDFSFPVVRDANWYRGYVDEWHKKDVKVLPYSILNAMSPDLPECAFYWREWFNPLGVRALSGWPKYASAAVVPSYIDFAVWKHRELAKDYGHDGLYVDFGAVCWPTLAPEQGLGYVRDGKEYPADFSIVATRELWKRVYTMFKELKPDSVIVAHMSSNVYAPILSFADVWLDGEHNWYGPLRDNYLDVLPLDQIRADFRAQAHGGIPWWLPQWYGALLDDKDVAKRQSNGQPDEVTVEKSHHLFGLGMLLDIGFWPICGMNTEATREYCAVQDEFGIADAQFFGYWGNSDLIGGQTEEIKASAYRKPAGGALIVVYNTTREAKTADLTVAWDQLKSAVPLEVLDAYTKKPMTVSESSLMLDVPPLNYRLVRVR